MKTKLHFRFISLLVLVTALTASCSKDNDAPPYVVSDQVQEIGSITDLGPVSGDVRHMVIVLGNEGNIYDGLYGEPIGSGMELNLNVYTDSDDHLAPGSYRFAENPVLDPFIIAHGDVTVSFFDEMKGSVKYNISGGVLSVSKDNNQYLLNYSLLLESGDTFSGSVSGALSYQDSY